MENISDALKLVSRAVDLDTNGFHQAAFSKYIQSLEMLIFYLSSLFTSFGFPKMVEKKKEVIQALCMIQECSERIIVILKGDGKLLASPSEKLMSRQQEANSDFQPSATKLSVYSKVQQENVKLFKLYKMRLERAPDKRTKTNLTLEFQRRLAENAVLAKTKYDLAVKQLQKERVQLMENAIRKLFEDKEKLNEGETEKRLLYNKVLEYVKTETWPSSWKLNPYDLTVFETAEKVFNKIIRCCEHPLTQWLILVQMNVKRKIDSILKEFRDYIFCFPELNSQQKLIYTVEENDKEIVFKCKQSDTVLPSTKVLFLENSVKKISSEVQNIIEDTLEIFYLVYKSLLPEDSEAICYHLIEQYFLKPLWSNLFTLFRILNLPSEYRICESMHLHKHCSPLEFGIVDYVQSSQEFYDEMVALLKKVLLHQSLTNKLRILVQVSQKISECDSLQENVHRRLGIDEMLPVLCYVIVKSGLHQLLAECYMLEYLFDLRYMLGEEGYALSSFLSALKCIEIKKLTESTEDKM